MVWFMAGCVFRAFCLFSIVGLSTLAHPAVLAAQSGGWGKPITAPAEPEPTAEPAEPAPPPPPPAEPTEPVRTQPNPDWADAPPTEYEERSPQNPEWVEETEPPPVGDMKRRASEFYDIRIANRDLVMPRGMMRGTFDTVVGKRNETTGPGGRPFGPTGTISTMNFGVSMSLAKDFEIGFSRYRMGSFPSIHIFPGWGCGGEGVNVLARSRPFFERSL